MLRLSLVFTVSIFLVEILGLASSVIYSFKCENVLNGDNVFAVNQALGYGSTLYNLIVVYIVRDKIRNIFDKIQEIYNGLYSKIMI